MNILNAIEQIISQDISDDVLIEAIQVQICDMAQINPDETFSID